MNAPVADSLVTMSDRFVEFCKDLTSLQEAQTKHAIGDQHVRLFKAEALEDSDVAKMLAMGYAMIRHVTVPSTVSKKSLKMIAMLMCSTYGLGLRRGCGVGLLRIMEMICQDGQKLNDLEETIPLILSNYIGKDGTLPDAATSKEASKQVLLP